MSEEVLSTPVPVMVVPAHPEIASLTFGEIRDGFDLSPRAMLLICIGGGIMCAFFIVGAILNWRGIDIDLDSKTGRISIKQFGSER